MWDSADWTGVVFVSDRPDGALRRRERCLVRAGLACSILSERRASGTYFKLCVREHDVVDAHLALRLGGFCRSARLRGRGAGAAVRSLPRTVWDQIVLLAQSLVDLVRQGPRRLPGLIGSVRVG
jgi:hypothetical protein